MELSGLLVSILAFVFAVFTYIIHDRKLNKQAKLLNRYQLDNIIQEKENSKKAIIEAKVIKGDKGKRTIRVCNNGKAKAMNVNVNFVSAPKVNILINPCPIDMLPKGEIDIISTVSLDTSEKIVLEFNWEDDFKKDNIELQMLQII